MKIGVKWGVILGVAVCLWTMVLHVLGWYTVDLKQGQRADMASILLPIAAIGMAIRERRLKNPGQTLTLAEGMATGLVTGLVSIPITAGFLWFYHHQINPAWIDHLVAYERAKMEAAGTTAAVLTERLEAIRASGRDSVQLISALIGTTIITAFLSIIFSLLLRRSPKRA